VMLALRLLGRPGADDHGHGEKSGHGDSYTEERDHAGLERLQTRTVSRPIGP
jgi:hypothetical protein